MERRLKNPKKAQRKNKEGDSMVAHFQYHKRPITLIEWSPHEALTLAVSSDDNQLTIWDLSLEKDDEEQVNAPENLPPQLLFVHQPGADPLEGASLASSDPRYPRPKTALTFSCPRTYKRLSRLTVPELGDLYY